MSHPPGASGQHMRRHPEDGDGNGDGDGDGMDSSGPVAGSYEQRSYHGQLRHRYQYNQTWQTSSEPSQQLNGGRAAGQTVTARMVDPSVASSDFGPGTASALSASPAASAGSPGLQSRPTSSTSRLGSIDGSPTPQLYHQQSQRSQNPSQGQTLYQQQQQQQPTIAALALADSQGHLGSELGRYTPQRLRADIRASHGFRSEPASGAASPVGAAPDMRMLGVGRSGAASAEEVAAALVYTASTASGPGAGLSPAPSALGVVFSAPAATAGRAAAENAAATKTKTTTEQAEALQQPGRSSNLGSGLGSNSSSSSNARMGHGSRDALLAGRPAGGAAGDAGAFGMYAHGGSQSQLSVLPENGSLNSYVGASSENNAPYHTAQNSAEFTPHTSSPTSTPSIAASATAASSSFSFRNSQRAHSHYHYSSSQPFSHQPASASNNNSANANTGTGTGTSNRYSTATATTATTASASATNGNRDSMFLRLKEKIKHLKPRSRPHSEHIADRRMPTSSYQSQQGQNHGQRQTRAGYSGVASSPSFSKASSRGNNPGVEAQLFGMPLGSAIRAAGVRVGTVAFSNEPCVVPSVIAVCGRHLWEHGQQTQGIFRINGSMKRVQKLQDEFNQRPSYGRHTEWAGYTLHDAATILRRYLITLPESVISVDFYSVFMEKYAEPLSDKVKARDFGLLIAQLAPEAQHTLLFMLELLSVFARPENCEKTLMNASNLAAVLQPCLLVHPGHVANPHEYGKAKDVVEFLIVNASFMYPTLAIQRQSLVLGPAPDGRKTSADDYVLVGGAAREGHGAENSGSDLSNGSATAAGNVVRGAGLIVFDSIGLDGRATSRGSSRPVSSDGGVALAATSPVAIASAPHTRWSPVADSPCSVFRPIPEHSQSTGNIDSMAMVAAGPGTRAGQSPAQPPSPSPLTSTSTSTSKSHPSHPSHPSHALHYHHQQQQPPPPRGDSLVTMNMAMSTPVMGTAASDRASQVRSLGSVTARLYDPSLANASAPTPPAAPEPLALSATDSLVSPPLGSSGSGWNSNRSSAGLSVIRYENTASASTQYIPRDGISPVGEQRRISGHARARRSMSFILPQSSPRGDSDDVMAADRLSKNMMDRSTNAVHARRAAEDRRTATYAGTDIGAHISESTIGGQIQSSSRPLPPVPTPMASATTGRQASLTSVSTATGFHMYPLPSQRNQQNGANWQSPAVVVTARLQSGHAVYQPGSNGAASYAEATDHGIAGQDMHYGRGTIPSQHPDHDRYHYQQQHQRQQQHEQHAFSPLVSSGSNEIERASWYLEGVPAEESNVYGSGTEKSEPANIDRAAPHSLSFSDAQQQKLHPIGRADPMTVHLHGSQQIQLQQQQQYHAATVSPRQYSSDGTKLNRLQRVSRGDAVANTGHGDSNANGGRGDKVSMTRLKNMFRIGGSSNSNNSNNNSISSSNNAASGSKVPSMASIGIQQQVHSQQHIPYLRQPYHPSDMPIPRRPRQPSTSTHDGASSALGPSAISQIQVSVPPGHLSIVYPDSPMSKADTLRRSSVDSLTKRLSQSGGISESNSGHAYLVDPDQSGVNLHAAPSNSTTLHSSSHMQQLQQHLQNKQHYSRRTGATVPGSVLDRSADNVPYAMRRLNSGDGGIGDGFQGGQRARPGTAPQDVDESFVLPDISNGSPLLSGFEFGASRESIYQQLQLQQGSNTSRRLSRRSATNNDNFAEDEMFVEGNSPRRSRSLRNTITSLRRKLSKSSRGGSGTGVQSHGTQQQQQQQYRNSSSSPDFAPLETAKAMATSAVAAAEDVAPVQNGH
ncbi:GTPase activating protein (GAP) for Rho1p [Coemansia sp. RSA 2598]|nr:GTPase activating protein (GAP) for Rho1p [Coemansia sp. RSA 2598]